MVDAYVRWTLYAVPWLRVFGGVVPLVTKTAGSPLSVTLAEVAVALNVLQGGLAVPLFNRGLDRYLRRGPAPVP
ncbi:hypothetical protein DY245_37905 [Streptomyces inhibens]|uniref:Uncharacterized protein n=1 Tax=Streptomyces inhibens TaxID=2293571 RepID=A0A371PSH3_STRIH|nr:hypothetical protein [Streptomyces inhibens]REK85436.1 hypothetical protein DY245_37905 [Streptomyces inhibens]